MFIIVIAKGKWVNKGGHLWIVKVYNYQIAYSEYIYSIYNNKKLVIRICLSLSINIYKAYACIVLYIFIIYTLLWRRNHVTIIVLHILHIYTGHVLMTNCDYFIWPY